MLDAEKELLEAFIEYETKNLRLEDFAPHIEAKIPERIPEGLRKYITLLLKKLNILLTTLNEIDDEIKTIEKEMRKLEEEGMERGWIEARWVRNPAGQRYTYYYHVIRKGKKREVHYLGSKPPASLVKRIQNYRRYRELKRRLKELKEARERLARRITAIAFA